MMVEKLDQGYDVVIVADSTSRWAEALHPYEDFGIFDQLAAFDGFVQALSNLLTLDRAQVVQFFLELLIALFG